MQILWAFRFNPIAHAPAPGSRNHIFFAVKLSGGFSFANSFDAASMVTIVNDVKMAGFAWAWETGKRL
ncbi:MAG: hypothetical protein LBK44_04775 [Spirochaetales bacterium]|jgi:hypothetical protein|nr:hypothetical protein [Spirochaetales bacterium]